MPLDKLETACCNRNALPKYNAIIQYLLGRLMAATDEYAQAQTNVQCHLPPGRSPFCTCLDVLIIKHHCRPLSKQYVSYFIHTAMLTAYSCLCMRLLINPLTPNDHYSGRTAPLTSKRCILYIYSTNMGSEYFKHGIYSSFFFSSKCNLFHNSNVFGSCIIHILYTRCAKI